MVEQLVAPVLAILAAFLLRGLIGLVNKALEFLGVEARIVLAQDVFNSIVAGIVVYMLSLLGVSFAARAGLF